MKKILSVLLVFFILLSASACAGDNSNANRLETDNNIEKIIVDGKSVMCIKLVKMTPPGALDGQIDLIPENDLNVIIRHEEVTFVTNEDGTTTKKQDLNDGTVVYGIYLEEDILQRENLPPLCYLVGIYSYIPSENS